MLKSIAKPFLRVHAAAVTTLLATVSLLRVFLGSAFFSRIPQKAGPQEQASPPFLLAGWSSCGSLIVILPIK
jgi:hypothetical protein